MMPARVGETVLTRTQNTSGVSAATRWSSGTRRFQGGPRAAQPACARPYGRRWPSAAPPWPRPRPLRSQLAPTGRCAAAGRPVARPWPGGSEASARGRSKPCVACKFNLLLKNFTASFPRVLL